MPLDLSGMSLAEPEENYLSKLHGSSSSLGDTINTGPGTRGPGTQGPEDPRTGDPRTQILEGCVGL